MRITRRQLKQIIKEELAAVLEEQTGDHDHPGATRRGTETRYPGLAADIAGGMPYPDYDPAFEKELAMRIANDPGLAAGRRTGEAELAPGTVTTDPSLRRSRGRQWDPRAQAHRFGGVPSAYTPGGASMAQQGLTVDPEKK